MIRPTLGNLHPENQPEPLPPTPDGVLPGMLPGWAKPHVQIAVEEFGFDFSLSILMPSTCSAPCARPVPSHVVRAENGLASQLMGMP
jgi:hypothetical protein